MGEILQRKRRTLTSEALIREARRVATETQTALNPLRSDYLNFLREFNPFNTVPRFRIDDSQPASHYDMELLSDDEDGVLFSTEIFERYYSFVMPFDYISDPAGWLARNTEEQVKRLAERDPATLDCPDLGCPCGVHDLSIHYYS